MILEASDSTGGRIKKHNFGNISVELGAGWIAGVGGKEPNPVWELAVQSGLRTCFSDYSNARYNIYDRRYGLNIISLHFFDWFYQLICVKYDIHLIFTGEECDISFR